eukprot:gnl/TRDRNA2_/TRDRNA2_132987_c0_seq1.p1 gnl/TRDRNA2_/TRDRNA2_132987_c0~~gnl/TRDRNA2_/TRDRNA2_132987_c0_seq1.p1  ORF type:complete len:266 (+),score=77.89 gnl/TRDRNA2_/TRDRNA2_132987_c0_seq1:46-843(+)
MDADDLADFASAVAKLKAEPSLLSKPELVAIKGFLESLGAKIPGVTIEAAATEAPKAPQSIDLLDDDDMKPSETPISVPSAPSGPTAADLAGQSFDILDSDDEDTERIPPDKGPFPEMPTPSVEEPDLEAATAAKEAAAAAIEAGDLDGALKAYTEAILTGATAMLHARRAEVLLKQSRPVAAIRDCDEAIAINPDSGKAYRIRGISNRKLGKWENAHQDLVLAQKLDYDDSVVSLQKLAADKAKKAAMRRMAALPPSKRAKMTV